MTFPNPKWQPSVSDTLNNAAAVDKGGGEVGLPITGHLFLAEQVVVIAGTVNYNGAYAINSKTTNEIVITATYVAETFAGTETVIFGRQPITKADFLAIEAQIQTQPSVRMQPPLAWVDTGTVRIEATADSPAEMAFTGMPNIYNFNVQVDGGLSDAKIRSAVAHVVCAFGIGGLFGTTQTEKPSQWYIIYALAADADTDYDLKAMPMMRVKSQTGQAIKTGTLITPATGINYGFTDSDLVGGMLYFLTGDSKGLMRPISVNDVDTDTRITYTGVALTVAVGDWFVVLPPNTNFRMVGTVFNNSSGHIQKFFRAGHKVQTVGTISCTTSGPEAVVEDIRIACPFATSCNVSMDGTYEIGHPESGYTHGDFSGQSKVPGTGGYGNVEFNLKFCRYRNSCGSTLYSNGYSYPPGCGY